MPGPTIPASLDWLRRSAAGRDWLAALPELLAETAARWSLRLGEPYQDSYVSLVVTAVLANGTPAVLKVQFPDRDSVHEAAALRLWDGQAAVRLLAHDESRLALLIERCSPGTPLSAVGPDRAIDTFAQLLPRLWRAPVPPFSSTAQAVGRWAGELVPRWEKAGRPCERRLVDTAVETLLALARSQREQVLLNQDLHANNVLRAEREPWLVIDPKPLIGERELAVAPIVRDYGLGHGRRHVIRRLDRLTSALGLDRERARRWSFAKAMVWAFQDDDGMTRHLETARWLLADRPTAPA